MNALRIHPTRVEGRLRAPPSKSHTHRAYILAALSGNGLVRRPLDADDTRATLAGLSGLGFPSTQEAAGTRVGGILHPGRRPIDAGESGTTLRLLVPLATAAAGRSVFTGRPRLAQRPLEPLLEALRALGASVERDPSGFPLTVAGPLRGGDCTVPGGESSQYVSGLLLAAPLAERDVRIHVEGPLASRPYVDLTLAMMRDRGVRVLEEDGAFVVPAGQRFRQRPYDVPGDWSSAAFLFACSHVTGGNVNVEGLDPGDPQGDRRVLDHLQTLGACVMTTSEYVSVAGCRAHPGSLDLADTPDLFPPLAAVAACIPGQSRVAGAPHLRGKESDRIATMAENLRRFGLSCRERPDGLEISGGKPQGAQIRSFGDHRVAMAGVVLALAAKGGSTLPDPDVVGKSYPGFFEDLRKIAPAALD